jgi:hypothetical protein
LGDLRMNFASCHPGRPLPKSVHIHADTAATQLGLPVVGALGQSEES